MSADAACIPCPVCLHTDAFNTIQSLKDRLIYVSTNNIVCPICQEEVNGLDKLTIHLFSHVNITFGKDARQKEYEIKASNNQEKRVLSEEKQKKIRSSSKNKSSALAVTAPVKFIKIYPKLPVVALDAMPVMNSNGTNNPLFITATINPDCPTLQKDNKCNICGVQFINEGILKMHNSIIHNLEDQNTQPTRYNCHLCTKHFKMRGSLMVHLRVAHYGFTHQHDIEPNIVDKLESKNKEKSQEDEKTGNFVRNDGKQWQCDVCNKFFTTKYFLKKHKRLHTGETPYACTQCNKTFTFQQSYHKHLLYHNDDKPHTCSFCGRSFKELSTLHNHQRIHTGEKPFACESCGKCFRQRVSYLVHKRIHTGAMPYKCTACEKSFRYKVSQRTHKCQAHPPGTVIRKTDELLEKLKKNNADAPPNLRLKARNEQVSLPEKSSFPEVSEANAELVRTGAQLSLEDMESDNFSIISETVAGNVYEFSSLKKDLPIASNDNQGNENNQSFKCDIDELIDSIPVDDKSISSPSDIFKNLCLSNEDEYLSILD